MVLNFEKIDFSPTMGANSLYWSVQNSNLPPGRFFRDLLTKILRMRIIRNILGVFVFWFITLTGTAHEIHHAAFMGDLVKLKMILEIDPQLVYARNIRGNTPLHCAAFCGRINAAEYLLARGANVNAVNKKGKEPIHCATYGRKIKSVAFLLSQGANINAEDYNGNTPLHIAASMGCIDIVKILLQNNADRDHGNNECKTPLDLALENGHTYLKDILL